jgi:opacity protein-like surface antigen
MKRLTLFFFIVLAGSVLQADFKLMGGLNLSWFLEEGADWTPKFGLVGGIGIEFDLTYRTLLEIDLLYFQKGGLLEFTDSKEKHILNAGSVPILIRSKISHGTSPFLIGGMEISSILSYKAKQNGGEAVDLENTILRLDYGIVAGAGIEFELQEELFLFFEMRGHYGLRNLFDAPLGDQDRRTLAVIFLIGVRS